jgi:uncharacterized protein (TIGR03086 family)
MAEPLDLLARALDQTHGILLASAGTDPDAPTPCRGWNLAALSDHVVGDLDRFQVAARGERPDWGQGEVTREDRPAAFAAGAEQVLAAWRAADLSATLKLPMGEVPASFVVNQQISEMAVHGWDLAQASGQPVAWDEEVAETALSWAQATLKPEFRGAEGSGKSFGPEVPARPDASAQDRLAAWFGRDPAHPIPERA